MDLLTGGIATILIIFLASRVAHYFYNLKKKVESMEQTLIEIKELLKDKDDS